MRTNGRCLALVLALLLAGPLPVRSQAPAATDDEQPVAEPPSMGAPEEPGKDAADQSASDQIG